jgi:hypothetical protein
VIIVKQKKSILVKEERGAREMKTDKDKPFAKSLEGKELKMGMLCPNCSAVMTIRTNNTRKIIEATRKDTLKEFLKQLEFVEEYDEFLSFKKWLEKEVYENGK